jgi:excinuclease ABC subunit A
MTCPSCNGKRFRPHILEVKFLGHSITDVLNLTLAETYRLFANHKRIVRKLQPAVDLGLGYLKLGQPSASLSGGESQRLKMVPFFSRRVGSGTVVILDEPTTGLHFEDVERLVHMMRELVKLGATVIVVEHNSEVVKAADYLVVLGPGSASEGGRVVESFDLEAV